MEKKAGLYLVKVWNCVNTRGGKRGDLTKRGENDFQGGGRGPPSLSSRAKKINEKKDILGEKALWVGSIL